MITIDGSAGEGGGQILRSALGLSLVTQKPFRIEHIRAGRKKPGLMRQHLTAVEAAVAVGRAKAAGSQINSQSLSFEPGTIVPGEYRFAVGTAGSATLVLQTVLPPLLLTGSSSRLLIEGGTHNPYAPPFDFLDRAFLPVLKLMGADVSMKLLRPGFYPAGGGKMEVVIAPARRLTPLSLLERGELVSVKARVLLSQLNKGIGMREINVIQKGLPCKEDDMELVEIDGSAGPGNIVIIEIRSERITEIVVGFGELGKAAEVVAAEAVDTAQKYLRADVPVGKYLADQLLIPLVLAGGGEFKTMAPSRHTLTNIEIIRQFFDVDIQVRETAQGQYLVSVKG